VAEALCSSAEDEGDGGKKFPKDLLAWSSAGAAVSSTPRRPQAAKLAGDHLHGRYGGGDCVRLELLEFPKLVGRIE